MIGGANIDRDMIVSINFFDQTSNKFDAELLGIALRRQEVVIFIDGFDEISPNYDDVVLALIKIFLDLSKIIYISTRPNKKNYLEEIILDDIKIYKMEILSIQAQIEYLATFWMKKWETNLEEAEFYCYHVLEDLPEKNIIFQRTT